MIDLGGFSISFAQRNTMVAVLIIYSVIIVGLGIFVKVSSNKKKDNKFASYMTGGGNLNAFELAMLTVTGALAGGTMVGSPGLSYGVGLAAMLPVYTGFAMTLGILGISGRKTAIVAHRVGATSPVQLLRHRYQSRVLAWVLMAAVVTFGITQSSSNLMIAARLFTAVTGASSYTIGLAIAVIAILVYTLSGGIKSLAKVSVIQGTLMVVIVLVLAFRQNGAAAAQYGSVEAAVKAVAEATPSMTSFQTWTPLFIMGMMLLYSVTVFTLPASIQGNFTYSSTKSYKRAIIIGIISITVLHLCMTGGSVLTKALNPNLEIPDYSVVYLATSLLPSGIAGLAICACFAAVQSTVAALLVVASASLVKDVIQTDINPNMDDKTVQRVNLVVTLIIAAVAIIIGVRPSEFTQLLNTFSTAGMMVVYLWPFFLGLYWKGATKAGAIVGAASGFIGYVVFTLIQRHAADFWNSIGNPHAFVPALIVSLILMVIVSKVTKKVPYGVAEVWFSSDYDEEFAHKFDLK